MQSVCEFSERDSALSLAVEGNIDTIGQRKIDACVIHHDDYRTFGAGVKYLEHNRVSHYDTKIYYQSGTHT